MYRDTSKWLWLMTLVLHKRPKAINARVFVLILFNRLASSCISMSENVHLLCDNALLFGCNANSYINARVQMPRACIRGQAETSATEHTVWLVAMKPYCSIRWNVALLAVVSLLDCRRTWFSKVAPINNDDYFTAIQQYTLTWITLDYPGIIHIRNQLCRAGMPEHARDSWDNLMCMLAHTSVRSSAHVHFTHPLLGVFYVESRS